jgi:DNA polymerase-3 subunit gamma/tau
MANQALYLKWRPQYFDEMIGQDHIVTTLLNSLRQDRIRHAYLFSGPRGTGKTTTARLLAKAVNCSNEDAARRPCGECRQCIAMAEGRFFDLIEIDAASHTGVDDVRDLRDKIAFAPSDGRYKVYIIDEVHRFSGAAFDALLKTLEEPPPHAIFVLATTELDKVPATIKSRCLLFEFRRVALRQVVERLQMICADEGIEVEPAALELIARQGTGSVRDSISLLDQVLADPSQQVTLELAQNMLGAVGSRAALQVIEALARQDSANALDIMNQAMDMGADPRQFGQQLVDHLRQIMLVQVGGPEVVDASDDMRALYQSYGQQMGRRMIVKAIRSFSTALAELRGGWQPQLPLELAIVESALPTEEALPPNPLPKSSSRPAAVASATLPVQMPSATALTLEHVRSVWAQVVGHPEAPKSMISTWRDKCTLVRFKALTLTLGVPLAERQLVEKHKPLLEKLLSGLVGQAISVKVEQSDQRLSSDNDLEIFASTEWGADITNHAISTGIEVDTIHEDE